MGHKINPKIFRIGNIHTWDSKWFSRKNYATYLEQDIRIREFLSNKLKEALIDKIEIERSTNKFTITIHATRPGLIIGKGGSNIESLKKEIHNKILKNRRNIDINIQEVKKPMSSSRIITQMMIFDIEKRVPYRKVMKQALQKVVKDGVLGVKVTVSGRLNGAEIARTEKLSQGNLPLHTMRADIDYSKGVARTTYGAIGIHVWIYKGQIFNK